MFSKFKTLLNVIGRVCHSKPDYMDMLEIEHYQLSKIIRQFSSNSFRCVYNDEALNRMQIAMYCLNIVTGRISCFSTEFNSSTHYKNALKANYIETNFYINTGNSKRYMEGNLPGNVVFQAQLYKAKAWHVYCMIRERYIYDWKW